VDTWCPLTTTAAPGSPRGIPLMHSSSDPSSRTLTGLDCFLRDIRTTVIELLCGDENERRNDSRRGFTLIVWIAIMTVIADNYAEIRVFSVSTVAALLRLSLVKKRILKNRKRWKKCYFTRTLRTDCGGIIGLVAAAEIHLVGVGLHLHRRVPVNSRRCCWWCRYSIRTLRTRKRKIIKTIKK